MSKVTIEQAKEEILDWLDRKKISQSLRDKHEDAIETLEEAIMDGILILEEAKNEAGEVILRFKQTLQFPFEKGNITELVYRSRLNDMLTRPHLKGVSIEDIDGRIIGIICALTGQPKGIISALDTTDKRIARSIAGFFM